MEIYPKVSGRGKRNKGSHSHVRQPMLSVELCEWNHCDEFILFFLSALISFNHCQQAIKIRPRYIKILVSIISSKHSAYYFTWSIWTNLQILERINLPHHLQAITFFSSSQSNNIV